jgi:hypothetical protein
MNEKFNREDRYACQSCPAFYKCEKGNISATAGGWEEKQIDGKKMTCCRPQEAAGAFRAMKQYAFYCLATPKGKMIAGLADWTGRTPTWCPRTEGQKNGK